MTNILKGKYNFLKLYKKQVYYRVELDCSDKNFLDIIAAALVGGVDVVELSGALVSDEFFLNIAHKVKNLAAQFDATFIVNGRADIAYLSDADGIFLSENDIDINSVRKIMGDNLLVGTMIKNKIEADYYLALKPECFDDKNIVFVNGDSTIVTNNQSSNRVWVSNMITNSNNPKDTVKKLRKTIL